MKNEFRNISIIRLCVFLTISIAMVTGCDWLARDLKGQVFVVQKNGVSLKLGLVDVFGISEGELRDHLLKKSQQGEQEKAKIGKRYLSAKAKIEDLNGALNKIKQKMIEVEKKLDMVNFSDEFKDDPMKAILLRNMLAELRNTVVPLMEAESEKQIKVEQKIVDEFEMLNLPAYYLTDIRGLTAFGKTDADGRFTMQLPRGDVVLVAHARRTVIDSMEDYYWAIKLNSVDLKKELYLSNDNLFETRCQSCMLIPSK